MAEEGTMDKEGTPVTQENPGEPISQTLENPAPVSRRGFLGGVAALGLTALGFRPRQELPEEPEEADAAGATAKTGGGDLENPGIPTNELLSSTNLLMPTAENIQMSSPVSRTGWTAEQIATFNDEQDRAKNWLMQVASVYQIVGDPEMLDAMQTYVSVMGNNLRTIPDYTTPLRDKELAITFLYPSFSPPADRSIVTSFTMGFPANQSGIRSQFRFYAPAIDMERNDPTQNEGPAFAFLHDVLLFRKYHELVQSLPDSAFEDIPKLRDWLNQEELRFRFEQEVYYNLGKIYDRVSPILREMGFAQSSTFKVLYAAWKEYETTPAPNREPREFYWLRLVNEHFYGSRIKNLNPDKNGVFLGPSGAGRFLRPLDIPWQ